MASRWASSWSVRKAKWTTRSGLVIAAKGRACTSPRTAPRRGCGSKLIRRVPLSVPGIAHGDELLGYGRMHRYGGIEIGLGGADSHRDAEDLHDLARVWPAEMAAEHTVGVFVDHEFHEHALIAPGQRVLHRPEVHL